ncbi:MAG: T9SS type A sorting domain-containing protein [bacterium]
MKSGRTSVNVPLCIIAIVAILLGFAADEADGARILAEWIWGAAYDEATGTPLAAGTLICYHDNVVFGFDRPDSICCTEVDSTHYCHLADYDTLDGAFPDIYREIVAEGYYLYFDTLTNYVITYPMPCGDDTCYTILALVPESFYLKPVVTTAVGGGELPSKLSLSLANYPNPFNIETTVLFSLPRSSTVRLEVYDLLGRQITTLLEQYIPAGTHRLYWDGRDRQGREVCSGVYYCVLRAGQSSVTRKVLLLK